MEGSIILVGMILFKYRSDFMGGKKFPVSYYDGLTSKVQGKFSIWKYKILSLVIRKILLSHFFQICPD